MRLTPADVHNVAFKKPSIGKRGYDEDEVDAFLDLVEAELARLIEENNELTQRVAAGSNGEAPQAAAAAQPVDAQLVEVQPVAAQPQAPVSVQKAVPAEKAVAPEPAVQPTDAGPAANHLQAARLLGLAQETAERLTGDAAAEAEATRSAAKAESDRLLAEAQAEADKLLTDAHSQSETMVSEATTRAEVLDRESRERAAALDREAKEKYSQVLDKLTTDRSTLERKIEDLRVYEREYRSRLKSWITDQLVQLEDGGAQKTTADQQVKV
jgi:DivIVA domain-containing protein